MPHYPCQTTTHRHTSPQEQEHTRATKQKYLQLAALNNTRSKMLKSQADAATHKSAAKRAIGRLATGEIEADPDRASKRLRKRKAPDAAAAAAAPAAAAPASAEGRAAPP